MIKYLINKLKNEVDDDRQNAKKDLAQLIENKEEIKDSEE